MAGPGREDWIRVPVGEDADRWATRGRCRRVLLVVHNVTAATRLLDVAPLFDDDTGVQLLATCPGSSPFRAGVAELLEDVLGVPVLSWPQALATPVDLAISASFGGELHLIQGKLAILSHGVGYTKRLATPDTGHRTPDTGHRTPDTGHPSPDAPPHACAAPVFGLSAPWLLHNGVPVADALVLSHPEQLDRLKEACPVAAPTGVIAGDPCFDRMLAARPYRHRFRNALGVQPHQRLIVVNSTWNPESLFGDGGDEDLLPVLLPRLASELPADEYRVAAVLHPNIWAGHGPGQIRAWLDRARRAGLILVDPLHHWRQALLAADAVIGDHGAVSFYAAALGTPVLLGAAPLAGLAPDSPVADFVTHAPRLDAYAPLVPQLDQLIAAHRPFTEAAEFVTSVPGRSAALLRQLFYNLMGHPEPTGPALPEPLLAETIEPHPLTAPLHVVTTRAPSGEISVTRYPDPRTAPEVRGEVHSAVHEDTRDRGRLALADVIHRTNAADDPRFGGPARWTAEVLARFPQCAMAAYVTGPTTCTVRTREGALLHLTGTLGADPALYASALYAVLADGPEPVSGLTVRTGSAVHAVTVTPLPDPLQDFRG
ncbi:hypothetical protein GCM10010329_41060 [Streptomyces spiroverticillatus]|uniref:Translation initiation factor 2 n=1 Tax=Streptomyces finlayi TaxID=67296 RepID=A0A919CAW4_9ACTN|nr:hypothetical protein [Streptomyces finlayi]GHA13963.1 hypothetical protein GCM10010329_41060 [Streptomyces spiroverticillatus]GHC97614.1 hypothetical protein GCM10010334_39180 [Streptomyces finlayi]